DRLGGPSRRLGRSSRPFGLSSRRIEEVLEEVGVGRDYEPRVAGLQALLIGLHRPIKGEEVWIPAEGLREDAVTFGLALAATLFALARRFRLDDRHFAVGSRRDAVGFAYALSTELRRLTLTLGPHAVEHALLVLL